MNFGNLVFRVELNGNMSIIIKFCINIHHRSRQHTLQIKALIEGCQSHKFKMNARLCLFLTFAVSAKISGEKTLSQDREHVCGELRVIKHDLFDLSEHRLILQGILSLFWSRTCVISTGDLIICSFLYSEFASKPQRLFTLTFIFYYL